MKDNKKTSEPAMHSRFQVGEPLLSPLVIIYTPPEKRNE